MAEEPNLDALVATYIKIRSSSLRWKLSTKKGSKTLKHNKS